MASLLRSKLEVPTPGGGVAERPRLTALLNGYADRRVIVVNGAAGFGKTTVLAHWAGQARDRQPVGWLSLDPGDNDPQRFWTYADAALQSGADVLVLDDFHHITSQQVLDDVDGFVSDLPDGVQLVLSGRWRPRLPSLPRLTVAGRIARIGAAELAFTLEEIGVLVNDHNAVGIDADELALLLTYTEGWAAAVALTVRRLQTASDPHDLLHTLEVGDRDLTEYLGAEVLGSLDPVMRDFVVRTSILEELTGPLCEEVTGLDDSGRRLESLDRSNLFVVPQGSSGAWFRYHHLFSQMLQHELRLRVSPEATAELHRRASSWYRRADLPVGAVRHAVAADDLGSVVDLIADSPGFSCFFEGLFVTGRHLQTAGHCIARLQPPDVADARVQLAAGWTLLSLADPTGAQRWLKAARASGRTEPDVQANIEILSGTLLRLDGDLTRAVETCRRGVELSPPSSDTYVPALGALGPNLYWTGEAETARSLLLAAIPHLQPPRALLPLLTALGHLALVEAEREQWTRAHEHATSATALAAYYGFGKHFALSAAHLALGMMAVRLEHDQNAHRHLCQAEDQARRVGEPATLLAALLTHAALVRRHGHLDEACARETEACLIASTGTDTKALEAVYIRFAHATPQPSPLRPPPESLTDKERWILRLLAGPLTQSAIGRELNISPNTVKTHVRAIYRKLDVGDRRQAVDVAHQRGMLP